MIFLNGEQSFVITAIFLLRTGAGIRRKSELILDEWNHRAIRKYPLDRLTRSVPSINFPSSSRRYGQRVRSLSSTACSDIIEVSD